MKDKKTTTYFYKTRLENPISPDPEYQYIAHTYCNEGEINEEIAYFGSVDEFETIIHRCLEEYEGINISVPQNIPDIDTGCDKNIWLIYNDPLDHEEKTALQDMIKEMKRTKTQKELGMELETATTILDLLKKRDQQDA